MKWRTFVWIFRIAVVAAVLYGAWLGVSHFGGKHYLKQGMRQLGSDPAAARKSFEIAAKLKPKDDRVRAGLGRSYLEAGDYGQAAVHLRAAAELKPSNFAIWLELGQASLEAGDTRQAKEAFGEALELRPDARAAIDGLAEAALAEGDLIGALAPLRKLHETAPDDLELAGQLVEALVANGHFDETLTVCKTALDQLADQPDVATAIPFLIARAHIYRQKGRWGDAIDACLRCLLIEAGNEDALAGLAEVPEGFARHLCPDTPAASPVFAPKSNALAFRSLGLSVVDVASGELTCLSTADEERYWRPVWSPKGDWICYEHEGALHVAMADDSKERKLVSEDATLPQLAKFGISATQASQAFPVQSGAAWSPDGARVAYQAANEKGAGVTCVVEVTSGKAVSTHASDGTPPKYAGSHAPSFSRDGRLVCGPLLYPGAGKPLPGLTLWSPAGQVKRQVPLPTKRMGDHATPTGVFGVRMAPDAQHIAVALSRGEGSDQVDLAMTDSQGKRSRIAVADLNWRGVPIEQWARWRDSKTLWMLQRSGSGPLDTIVRALTVPTEGNPKRVEDPYPVMPIGSSWAVSPDGKLLAMAGPELGGQGIWLFNLEELREGQE